MRFKSGILSVSIVVIGLCLRAGSGQAPSSSAPKAAKTPSDIVIIRGTLLNEDKTPLASNLPFNLVMLTVAPVEKEGENSTSYTLSNESLNKNSAQPNAKGRFTIKMDRATVAKGKKFMILCMIGGGKGLEPLRHKDQAITFQIDDKTTTIDLGTIIVKSK